MPMLDIAAFASAYATRYTFAESAPAAFAIPLHAATPYALIAPYALIFDAAYLPYAAD